MPTYRNARTGGTVTVSGDDAKRLDGIERWSRVKAAPEQSATDTVEGTPVPSGPADAGIGQGTGTDAATPVGTVKANTVERKAHRPA